MKDQNRSASLGFTDEKFPVGTHMCLVYDNEQERQRVIAKFLEAGLLEREKVAYFADTTSPGHLNDWLSSMGIEIPPDGKADQLSVSVAQETYCPHGEFVPDEMLDTLRAFHGQVAAEGFPCGRVSGEMSWALRGIPGSDRLMEYEARVNDVLVTHPITAICQYDARKFDGTMILDVLRVHPMMIVEGRVVQNPYFMRPQDFLQGKTEER